MERVYDTHLEGVLVGYHWLPLMLPLPSAALVCSVMESQRNNVDELIQQLGSKRYREREAATRELLTREEAIPALRKAMASPDPERSRRAAQILEEFARRKTTQTLTNIAALVKRGQADRFTEALVHKRDDGLGESLWQLVADLAGKLVDLEKQSFGITGLDGVSNAAFPDFRRYVTTTKPKFITAQRLTTEASERMPYVLCGEEILLDTRLGGSVVVSAGRVRASHLGCCVVFAGGPIDIQEYIADSVVVCDGELKVGKGIVNSLVIVRGQIDLRECVVNSRLLTTGTVRRPSSIILGKSVIREQEAVPLNFVRFFELSRVGLEITGGAGGVRITKVHGGMSFARAGLRAGDLVTAVNKEPAGDPEVFRRLVRRHLVHEEDMVLSVLRDGKVLEIRVAARAEKL